MYIRKVEIKNYKGIRSLTWHIPKSKRLICLIGPGDSGKTSVLEALHLALSDRWWIPVADTDFYKSDPANPIEIRVTLSDLSDDLKKDTAFGLMLSGIDDEGALHQDPEEGLDPCVIVQLKIDEFHEPVWTIEKVDGSQSFDLKTSRRQLFAALKVDERVDAHLRWTHTSALGRLSKKGNSYVAAMAEATRAAGAAISSYENADLDALTGKVTAKINAAGGGSFSMIKPGLDTSLSSVGGNLALYEDGIPLTNYGLGSRRIAGLAVQQIASEGKSLVFLDEVETGLEPHRLVKLMHYLKADPDYAQVFITTHSPIAVEQALTEDLAIMRSDNTDEKTIKFIPEGDDLAIKIRRSRPSSFLAKRIIVVEGRTEEGLLKSYVETWDKEQVSSGLPIAAGEGSVIQDGEGGSQVPVRAMKLKELGYEVGMLLDNDDRSVDLKVLEAEAVGIVASRWSEGMNTEGEIVSHLSSESLNEFIALGASQRGGSDTVRQDLIAHGLPAACSGIESTSWINDGTLSLGEVRTIVAKAASKREWFKTIDGGFTLGTWTIEHSSEFDGTNFEESLRVVKSIMYPSTAAVIEVEQGAE